MVGFRVVIGVRFRVGVGVMVSNELYLLQLSSWSCTFEMEAEETTEVPE